MQKLQLKILSAPAHTSTPRLCDSCAFGLVMRGDGEEFVYCHYIREFVNIRVTECTRYSRREETSRDESVELLERYTLE